METEDGATRRTASAHALSLSLPALLAIAWFAGAMLSLSPMILALWRIRCIRPSGLPWLEGQPLVNELAAEAGLSRFVEVLQHEAVSVPMTSGAVHPAIVLPADASTWGVDHAAAPTPN